MISTAKGQDPVLGVHNTPKIPNFKGKKKDFSFSRLVARGRNFEI